MLQMFMGFEIDDILHESFKLELELLKNKYEINDDMVKSKVRQIADMATRYQSSSNELSLDDLLELAELDIEVVEFYLWSKYNMSVSSIASAKELFKEIEYEGYVIVGNDYLLCYRDSDLNDFYEEKLDGLLSEVQFVEDNFDSEELARMWIDEVPRDSVIKRLLQNERDVQEILNLDLEMGRDLSNGQVLMYSVIE